MFQNCGDVFCKLTRQLLFTNTSFDMVRHSQRPFLRDLSWSVAHFTNILRSPDLLFQLDFATWNCSYWKTMVFRVCHRGTFTILSEK